MSAEKNKKKFEDFVSGPSKLLEDIKWREQNEEWLNESARIAILILTELKSRDWTKQDLAIEMGVTPQYISKLVKGSENLTLETICKLQRVLGLSIIDNNSTATYSFKITSLTMKTTKKTIAPHNYCFQKKKNELLWVREMVKNDTLLEIDQNEESPYEEEKSI